MKIFCKISLLAFNNNNQTSNFNPSNAFAGDDEPNDSGLGSAGTLASPSSSRARMLAQQRDLQLKKRMNTFQAGGPFLHYYLLCINILTYYTFCYDRNGT